MLSFVDYRSSAFNKIRQIWNAKTDQNWIKMHNFCIFDKYRKILFVIVEPEWNPIQRILPEGEGLSTVDLLIGVACFVKSK
jgi:hypothetical protein